MIIVNDFQPLTIITKRSILVIAAVLDPSLVECCATLFLGGGGVRGVGGGRLLWQVQKIQVPCELHNYARGVKRRIKVPTSPVRT